MSPDDSAPSDSTTATATATEPAPPAARVVGRAVEDGWTEAFVSPRSPTGALFQLMEYHDDYGEKGADDALFVRGERLDS
ncbi:hypothetical protein [Haloferax volcanii]|uniref:Uncharacterized protein n=2 Tax=Haloferax volcanii TaxID=2246 RepID=A0A384KJ57_HALVD|nr:hypothetical protein [Haloferax volcanii]ELY37515.1 hypothetical protein C498_00415 [Haloferax volcanii DS2]MBS8120821.1 hypothetical protein [Haloferax volcanii]MBS8125858.1 hypothetical protein [Haloferax volcanii]MBS8129711.1 hypothetical protein [Haloferax volcanii]MBS8133576.1 hypothetical protein [Haloferax volcanii]